jgi:hypothetical protein
MQPWARTWKAAVERLALIGLVLYGVGWSVLSLWLSPLGLTPEDVGASIAWLTTRTGVLLGMLAGTVFLLAIAVDALITRAYRGGGSDPIRGRVSTAYFSGAVVICFIGIGLLTHRHIVAGVLCVLVAAAGLSLANSLIVEDTTVHFRDGTAVSGLVVLGITLKVPSSAHS